MRKYFVFGGLALILVLILALGAGMGLAVAGPNDVTVSMSGTAASGSITYSIVVSNKGTDAIGNIYVAGAIPSGATFDSVGTLPAGAGSLGQQGDVVAFLVTSVPANGSVTLSYTVKGTTVGPANAWLSWTSPSAGSTMSASVTQAAAVAAGAPKRGCPSCHVGKYSLANEARSRAGDNHPKIADDTTVEGCLGCHKSGGVAPIILSSIVHPAHMFSATFKEHYGGNCFTCHDVSNTGDFKLLTTAVEVNDKGVPTKLNAQGYAAAAK